MALRATALGSAGSVFHCPARQPFALAEGASPSVQTPLPRSAPPALCLSRRVVLQSAPSLARPSASGAVPTCAARASEGEGDAGSEKVEGKEREGSTAVSRRNALFGVTTAATWQLLQAFPPVAEARERRQRTDFAEDSYSDAGNGLKYYEVDAGKGKQAEMGEHVTVHFEVKFGPLMVVSTRESKLLGGNRAISQPYEFTLGAAPGSERRRADAGEGANGLFSAQAAPKPPKALYAAVEGMRVGGKRSVLVPPELGYGSKGYNEIPPGAQVQMIIDLLDVSKPE